jgi:acetylornithine deacetylase/succinyl-diaminopimelate desuccinylase-like protein
MQTLLDYYSTHHERFITEWKEFLSFKSISTDPAFHEDCEQCARWVQSHLTKLGFSAEVWETASKPVVFAERLGNPSKPSILFYGHYDVQPVDPLDLWQTGPFEPQIRDGRMYARGAEDNKGQVFSYFKALEALLATGADLPTIKVIIEGEEECGSEALHAGLPGWSERIKADILMVADTGMVAEGLPTITMGLRGIAHCEVRAYGPKMDIHSGVYGGMVLNPLQALSRLLASLHKDDGSVAVPGFYDGVAPPTDKERSLANGAPVNIDEVVNFLGVPLGGGEKGYTPLERRGLRPTLEINGIGGGYQGAGGKTVIPSHAIAKLSMRLVAGQDPDRVLGAVVSFLKRNPPEGITFEVVDDGVGGPALQLPADSAVLDFAQVAIRKAFGRDPAYTWEGASIPIIPLLSQAAGAAPLLVGFGMPEDNIHSPNESYSLRQFEEGFRYVSSFYSCL